MTQTEEHIGYCPYCCTTLRVYRDPERSGVLQVVCGPRCRNVDILESEVRQYGGLRQAWEVKVEWRSKWK